jgi:hypothetical protein
VAKLGYELERGRNEKERVRTPKKIKKSKYDNDDQFDDGGRPRPRGTLSPWMKKQLQTRK